MDESIFGDLIEWAIVFYKNDKDLAIFLMGAIGWGISSKVLPIIYAKSLKLITFIGKKIGGRLGFKSIREVYLNWLVYKTKDLNLTGIIGTGEKPKLEQIFLSLRIVNEQEKSSRKMENTEEFEKKPFYKTLFSQYRKIMKYILYSKFNPFSILLNKIRQYELEQERASKEKNIFIAHPFWKIYRLFDREGIKEIVLVISFSLIFSLIFYIIPRYGLILKSNIYTIWAFIGSFLWSILIIIGLLLSYSVLKNFKKSSYRDFDDAIPLLFIVVLCLITPIISIYNVIQEKVIYDSQSPLAIELGVIFGLILLVLSYKSGFSAPKEPSSSQIGNIISSNDYIAILGKPGSGKSTFSQFLALTFAQEKAGDYKLKKKGVTKKRFGTNEWFLPLFIPLREISKFLVENEDENYDSLIIEAFRQIILPSSIKNIFNDSYIKHMLKNKKCIFLLDGLDEVQNGIEFNAVIKEINGIISRFPGNKVIVTSRYSGWRGGVGSFFNVLEIENLNDQEISTFIDSWYHAIEENRARILSKDESRVQQLLRMEGTSEKADKLKQAFSNNKSIRQIAENPLLLSIICFVHYNKTLPKERLRLYQDCNNLLLSQWDEEKGLAVDDTNLTLAHKEDIVQEIAFSLHTGKIGEDFGRKEATIEEIIPIVEKKLKEFKMDSTLSKSLFQKLIERSGIIVVTEKYAEKYSFSHLTFQEFYAAEYVYRNNLDLFELIPQVSDNFTDALNGWWREVILLYCLLIKDPTEIIECLYQDSEDDILQQNFQIAVQCLDESIKVPNLELRNDIIEKMLNIRNHGISESNVESLDPNVKSYLVKSAQNPFFYRHVIINKIVHIDAEKATLLVPNILQLLHSPDRNVRLIAVEALNILILKYDISQAINSKKITELLSDADSDIRIAAAELILNYLPRPLDDDLLLIILNIFVNSYSTISNISFGHFIIKDKINFRNSSIEYNRILNKIIEASSENALIEVHNKIYEMAFEIFNDDWHFDDYLIPAVKSLIQLDDEELKEAHKSQLLDALLKGNESQQVYAIFLLSELYSSDNSIIRLVLDKLEAPSSKVRIAAVSSIPRLNLKEKKLKQVLDYLEIHRVFLVKLKIYQKYIIQILTGKGKIGINEDELVNLECTLKDMQPHPNIFNKEISALNEWEYLIDKFLRKEELNKIMEDWMDYRSISGVDIEDSNHDDDLFNVLENSDNTYLKEAILNVLLKKSDV